MYYLEYSQCFGSQLKARWKKSPGIFKRLWKFIWVHSLHLHLFPFLQLLLHLLLSPHIKEPLTLSWSTFSDLIICMDAFLLTKCITGACAAWYERGVRWKGKCKSCPSGLLQLGARRLVSQTGGYRFESLPRCADNCTKLRQQENTLYYNPGVLILVETINYARAESSIQVQNFCNGKSS